MPSLLVLGAQWGDEGKGKIVDLLSGKAHLVVRFQGGANAGHTLVVKGVKTVLHQIPSGIMNPRCLNVIGNGCVVDPELLVAEILELRKRGVVINPKNLLIAGNAHMVSPLHKKLDRLEGGAIGTTGKGIGPCYTSKASRRGIRMEAILGRGLRKALAELSMAHHPGADDGGAVSAAEGAGFLRSCSFLKPFIGDAQSAVYEAVISGKRILLEGAQGTLLDIDHGTYPFVTSSSTTIGGAFTGTGVFLEFRKRIAVVKAFQTRVGNGPFPTELKTAIGNHLRTVGAEFGATTGRPRRCGWLDLSLLRKACIANGFNYIALTKLDCLTGIDPIKVAIDHDSRGRPVYRELRGWDSPIDKAASFQELPKTCRDYVGFIEKFTGVRAGLVSTGPDRDQTLIRETIW